ncbi:MAG: hypothetical protein AAFW98_16380 [Pseudomonadota bacterium]
MRFMMMTAALILVSTAAWAQAPDTEPAAQAEPTVALELELERLRADFRARFVDYDERLQAMARRIEALEAMLAEVDGIATDKSAVTMEPEDAPTAGDTGPNDTGPNDAGPDDTGRGAQ